MICSLDAKEYVSGLGSCLLPVAIVVVGTVSLMVLFFGAAWESERLLPFFTTLSLIALGFSILIVLPLAIPRATRSFASIALFVMSYIFGITVWMKGLLLCLVIWGIWSVLIGVVLAGIGVFPIAVLATTIEEQWTHLIELFLLVFVTYTARIGAIFIAD